MLQPAAAIPDRPPPAQALCIAQTHPWPNSSTRTQNVALFAAPLPTGTVQDTAAMLRGRRPCTARPEPNTNKVLQVVNARYNAGLPCNRRTSGLIVCWSHITRRYLTIFDLDGLTHPVTTSTFRPPRAEGVPTDSCRHHCRLPCPASIGSISSPAQG